MLSNLDLTKDVLDESLYQKMHFSSPGCDFKLNDEAIHLSNNTDSEQQSYLSIGKLYNYVAIDLDIQSQIRKSSNASILLSLYKDDDNKVVITQRDFEAENKKLTIDVIFLAKELETNSSNRAIMIYCSGPLMD